MADGGHIKLIFGALLVCVIVLALAPTVATFVAGAPNDSGEAALYNLILILWPFLGIGTVAAAVYKMW